MKIAISVPDSIHEEAERYAARRGISRSELYRRALQAYLRREDRIVEQLDAVYGAEDSSLDPILEELQRRTFARDDRSLPV
ncbi:MAG: ribbon-helix-helix protein, CopG family [Spirochaetaceae bacterium]|nr:MAG: ribbon-helix-helix protein, CopG family [Spirochaetaceae bacterium]